MTPPPGRDPDRLEALFARALELPPEEREAFLEAETGSDAETLEELRSLLAHASEADFLDRLGERVVAPRAREALLEHEHGRLADALGERYRLRRRIGRGGMATVYLADDLRHERPVALKVLDAGVTAAVGAQRFLEEIRTTAKLQHSHILPLFDSGEAAGSLYYVMPYVEGESLRARLDRERQLPVDEAVGIATQLADALDYAHRHGVVHRDLKPGNVMLHEGEAFLTDFGIALAVERAEAAGRLTQTGTAVGTPLYMSPEQASGQGAVGPPSDLYSLGCVLYEMLAGEPPHTGPTPQAIFSRILTGEVEPLTERRRSVPVHVDAAVRRTLEKLPADRFQGARAFTEALHDPDFRYEPAGGGRERGRSGRRTLGMPPRVTAAAGAAVVVASGWGWWTLSGRAEGATDAEPDRASLAAPIAGDTRASIAILPFRDMSQTGDQAYLGEGIAEEILNALSKIQALRVAARTSSYRLRDHDLTAVADSLGVGAVLEGSVRREGDSIRISARLVDGATNFQLWSDQYDRGGDNIIAIQEDIARRVADALRVELAGPPGTLVSAHGADPDAYDRYLLGRSAWNDRGVGIGGSIEHFQEALRLDPDFALAYSGLADAYVLLFEYNRMDPEIALPLARAAAERALALDPDLAEGHTSLAEVLAAERQWDESEERFRRALEINPGYLTAHHWYGWLLTHLARHGEAIEYLRGAKALDPLSPIVRVDLAAAYYHARMYAEALEEAEACMDARLCTTTGRVHARTLLALSRPEEALADAERYSRSVDRVMSLAALGREEEARDGLRAYREAVGPDALDFPITHLYLAEMLTALGDRDAALDAIERADDLGLATGPILIREWPAFDPIRDHPRFQAVLARLDRVPRG